MCSRCRNFFFPIGLLNDQSFVFAAINDEDPEGEELVELAIEVTSGDVVLLIDTVTIHIQPSDLTYPVYDIATVRSVDFVSGERTVWACPVSCAALRTVGTTTRQGSVHVD